MDFSTAKQLFDDNQIKKLASSKSGMRFLKLRSLSRKEYMEHLIRKHSLQINETNSRKWLEILYNSNLKVEDIDSTITELYEIERITRKEQEDQLQNELYKIQSIAWGGLHYGNLEKSIVDQYIKTVKTFSDLDKAIEGQIHQSMRSYVIASWYNHCTSIIIEDIFKDHPKVVPAIGLIKKIDFFLNDKPYDLKVTFLPEGYIKEERKSLGLPSELSQLKKMSFELGVVYDSYYDKGICHPT